METLVPFCLLWQVRTVSRFHNFNRLKVCHQFPCALRVAPQLSERSTATKMARSGRPADALCHLQRALAIVNVVRAQQPADQGEIDTNKVK